MGLRDKVALVTGASRGIGKAVAKLLTLEGARACICARDGAMLDEAKAEIEAAARNEVLAIVADVSQKDSIDELLAQVIRARGGVDILVNNAGGPPPMQCLDVQEQDWQSAINTNLMSVIHLSTAVVPMMAKKRWGRIINLTSLAAKEPDPDLVLSNVTRAGVAAFAKTLAFEVAHLGITVNTILTGAVLTERFISLVKHEANHSGRSYEEVFASIHKSIPVGRIASPEEFAAMITFIASDQAGFFTGVALELDGGQSRSVF